MISPYRNEVVDIQDGLVYILDAVYGLSSWPSDIRFRRKRTKLNVKSLLKDLKNTDPYGDWGGWKAGVLVSLSETKLMESLRRYRGISWADKASEWLKNASIPAIIVLDSPEYGTHIADGRGRLSLAVGMNMTEIPATILEPYFDR